MLRPVEGTETYLVFTRWSSRADFEAWSASQAFASGHAQSSGRPAGDARPADGPAGSGLYCAPPIPGAAPTALFLLDSDGHVTGYVLSGGP